MEENKNNGESSRCEKKIKELNENWCRALADYKNLERRVEKERALFVKLSSLILLEKLFPVYDSLKLALSHHKELFEPVYQQLLEVLKSEGLKLIAVEKGSKFDPERMEVLEGPTGETVVRIAQDGFELNGKVVRPARVELNNDKVQSSNDK